MDENRPSYSMQAPAARSPAESLRLPGRDELPRVDDHLYEPETSRTEVIGGRVVEALPAEAPHAIQHVELDYVVRSKTAAPYRTAGDLKTRVDEESDFASDTAVLRDGIDPATGSRYLEELAFEVVSTQSRGDVTEKAERMHRRGVRRIFAVFLKTREVAEWSAARRRWETLDPASSIEDPCLAHPLEVAALLDAAAADDAVAAALAAKGNPVIEGLKAESRAAGQAAGRAEGKAEAILAVLEARGLAPSESLRRRILTCTDPGRLERWLARAAVSSSVDEVIAGD